MLSERQTAQTRMENDMTTPDGWKLFETTRELQIQAYGKDPESLTGDELADYWSHMHSALIDELSEFLAEVSWKPWSNERGVIKDRKAALGELIDAQHFMINLALSIGATEEEFWDAYKEKQKRNRARQAQAGGYNNDAMKCPNCRRELDAEGAYQVNWVDVTKNEAQLECRKCRETFVLDTIKTGGKLP